MARTEMKQKAFSVSTSVVIWMVFATFFLMNCFVNGERLLKEKKPENFVDKEVKQTGIFVRVIHFLWEGGKSSYEPVWPVSNMFTFFCL